MAGEIRKINGYTLKDLVARENLATNSDIDHNHDDRYTTKDHFHAEFVEKSQYETDKAESEVNLYEQVGQINTKLNKKANIDHNHDELYATKEELDQLNRRINEQNTLILELEDRIRTLEGIHNTGSGNSDNTWRKTYIYNTNGYPYFKLEVNEIKITNQSDSSAVLKYKVTVSINGWYHYDLKFTIKCGNGSKTHTLNPWGTKNDGIGVYGDSRILTGSFTISNLSESSNNIEYIFKSSQQTHGNVIFKENIEI